MILLTSPARVGKSTAIKKIINMLGPCNCCGFYSEEVRQNGERTGFQTITLSGKTVRIADVGNEGEGRVGRYGVHVKAFEDICIPELESILETDDGRFLVIDEIGPMQLLSQRYKDLLYRILHSERKCIGTIVYDNDEWLEQFKNEDGVQLIKLTADNRNSIPLEICDLVTKDDSKYQSKVRKARNYIQDSARFSEEGPDRIIMHSTHDTRVITRTENGYHCTCDYYAEKGTCSHIMSVITLGLL